MSKKNIPILGAEEKSFLRVCIPIKIAKTLYACASQDGFLDAICSTVNVVTADGKTSFRATNTHMLIIAEAPCEMGIPDGTYRYEFPPYAANGGTVLVYKIDVQFINVMKVIPPEKDIKKVGVFSNEPNKSIGRAKIELVGASISIDYRYMDNLAPAVYDIKKGSKPNSPWLFDGQYQGWNLRYLIMPMTTTMDGHTYPTIEDLAQGDETP